jgi:hypothetical protein
MRFTNFLITLLCASALQGCITYYPSTYQESDAVNYSRDDIDAGWATEELVDYSDMAFYPWWSLDYYYLGGHYYRPYALSYWYYPFYRPYSYYAWYDPWWRMPRYSYAYPYWYDPYWHSHYQKHHDATGYRDQRSEEFIDPRDRASQGYRPDRPSLPGPTSRSISMTPSSVYGDRGMQVRSRSDRKVFESHIGPGPVRAPSASGRRSPVVSIAPSQGVAPPVPAPGPVDRGPAKGPDPVKRRPN